MPVVQTLRVRPVLLEAFAESHAAITGPHRRRAADPLIHQAVLILKFQKYSAKAVKRRGAPSRYNTTPGGRRQSFCSGDIIHWVIARRTADLPKGRRLRSKPGRPDRKLLSEICAASGRDCLQRRHNVYSGTEYPEMEAPPRGGQKCGPAGRRGRSPSAPGALACALESAFRLSRAGVAPRMEAAVPKADVVVIVPLPNMSTFQVALARHVPAER